MRSIVILMAVLCLGLQSCKKSHVETYIQIFDEADICSYWDDNPCLPYGFNYSQDYGPCTGNGDWYSYHYQICNGPTFSGNYLFQPDNSEITNSKNVYVSFQLRLTSSGLVPALTVYKTDLTAPYTIREKVNGGTLTIYCKQDTLSPNFQPYHNKLQH